MLIHPNQPQPPFFSPVSLVIFLSIIITFVLLRQIVMLPSLVTMNSVGFSTPSGRPELRIAGNVGAEGECGMSLAINREYHHPLSYTSLPGTARIRSCQPATPREMCRSTVPRVRRTLLRHDRRAQRGDELRQGRNTHLYMKIFTTHCFLLHMSFNNDDQLGSCFLYPWSPWKEPTIRYAQLTGHVRSRALGFSS